MREGPSRYVSVTNCPLMYIDPTGLQNFGPEAPMTRMGHSLTIIAPDWTNRQIYITIFQGAMIVGFV